MYLHKFYAPLGNPFYEEGSSDEERRGPLTNPLI